MAKKSTATRQANAARRSQSMSRAPEVTLVRQPKTASGEAPVANAAPAASTSSAKQVKSTAVVIGGTTRQRIPEVAKTPTARPVSPKPESVARTPGKTQASRVARAQTSQRVRTVSRVSPEQYSYVKNDLRFIGILAASMFAVIVVLSFVLPHLLPQ
jgi:hypothetical protein